MVGTTVEQITEVVELAEQLQAGRDTMLEPQDLPGRYARAVKAIDRVLQATSCAAVLGGGWAVWRHGFTARLTRDLDIALPSDRLEEFMRVASVAGFEILPQALGRWPKLRHKDSNVKVDILPEGARPGTAKRPAPTTIPHPASMGGEAGRLRYMRMFSLIELKLAAGRVQDEADVIELIRCNPQKIDTIREYLLTVHGDYVVAFDRLVERAREQEDR